MKNRHPNEWRWRVVAIAAITPTIALTAVILCSLIRPIFMPRTDPLDEGIDKIKRVVATAIIVDSTNNGFQVSYASKADITPARYAEMAMRPHIRDSLDNLKRNAPRHFGSMLYVDIYEFTSFAQRYHPDPELVLHNVVIFGREKMNLYIGPNPRINNPGRYLDMRTRQGIQFIGQKEISRYRFDSVRVYRYLHCRLPHERSDSDEHFSHFSEDDRLR